MKKIMILLIGMLAATTSYAFAATTSTGTPANITASAAPSTSVQTSPGFYIEGNTALLLINELNAGYMFNQYVGVEIGHAMWEVTPVALNYVAIKGDYHFGGSRWSMFAKVGGGDFLDSTPSLVVGAGVGCDLGTNSTLVMGATGFAFSGSDEDDNGTIKSHYAGWGYPYIGYSYHF